MSEIFVMRERLQKLYAQYSTIVDKGLQFGLAFLTFFFISQTVGFMKAAASIFIVVALAALCTFLSTVFTVLISAGLVLVHMYKFSLGIFIVTALIYLIMFICYFKFSPKYGAVILLVPIAFYFKVPYVVPLACGLLAGPSLIVPVAFGTIIYFMLTYIKTSASVITGMEELIPQMSLFIKQLVENKELWITVIAFAGCILVTYTIRTFSLDHAWFIAVVAGGIVNIVVLASGAIIFDTTMKYGSLFIGCLIAIAFGFLLELFVFAVDYTKSERLQYEDDDYCYYVKAIPKISVAIPKKTVKQINEHQKDGNDSNVKKESEQRKKHNQIKHDNPDAVLFEQSLKKDLDL